MWIECYILYLLCEFVHEVHNKGKMKNKRREKNTKYKIEIKNKNTLKLYNDIRQF